MVNVAHESIVISVWYTDFNAFCYLALIKEVFLSWRTQPHGKR
jgi:hypothetical protein